ncbi:AraC family transcriptional regulator [Paenibacillus eucommiae]|nr:AraC family transcriptional regulator [Paenibacillus eucommiae]
MFNKAANDYLDAYARHPAGSLAAFHVHYWGHDPMHLDNLVHSHSFFELCYVLYGEGSYWEEGAEYVLMPGTLFCSRPQHSHQIRSQKGMYLLFVGFELIEAETSEEGKRLFDQLAVTADIVIHQSGESAAAHIWRALMLHAEAPSLTDKELLGPLAYNLLLSLQALFCKSMLSPAKLPSRSSAAQMLVNRALMFIHDNIGQPLSLEEVARYLHISPRHLSRLFARFEQTSFTDVVKQERVRKAAFLLQHSALSIKEIADASGFSSVHYFTKVFAEEKAQTPGAYRKMMAGTAGSFQLDERDLS